FRDPLNRNRRFLPIRLDDAEIDESLAPYSFVDWRRGVRDTQYPVLYDVCHVPVVVDVGAVLSPSTGVAKKAFRLDNLAHWFNNPCISCDINRIVSGSVDGAVRLWDLESGNCLRILEGHTDSVYSVAL